MPVGDLGFVGATPVSKDSLRQVVEKLIQIPAILKADLSGGVEFILEEIGQLGGGNNPVQLDSITLIPSDNGITGHAGDYVRAIVYNNWFDSAGAAQYAIVAQLNMTTVGGYPAYRPITIPLVLTNRAPRQGDVLTLWLENVGTGQDVVNGAVRIRYRG